MDTFDNIEYDETPEENPEQAENPEQEEAQPFREEPPVREPVSAPYHNHGTGRRESPYADSPYEMHHAPRQEYRYRPQTQRPPKAPKAPKPRRSISRGIITAALAVVMIAGSCLATASYTKKFYDGVIKDTTQRYDEQIGALQKQIDGLNAGRGTVSIPTDGSAMTPAQLYASQVDSVVAITTTIQSPYGSGQASGSGFILSEDGYVITNYHVVEDSTTIQVVTHNGEEYDAKLVGKDSTNDLAVLKVDATGLSATTLGSSNDLVIGDMVVAIGNPLGELASTQTVGYISGIDREISTGGSITTINMIQTDAAINSGNSGGPLFNMYGQVIGITTAKYSGTSGSGASIEGIGFAIPIDDVEPLIRDLIDFGYVTGAYMAVTVQDTDSESASMYGIPTGAYIVSVVEGGAADRAGIRAKDIVIGLDQYEVSNVTDLTRALRNYKAGDTATVKLFRSGAAMTLEITFDEKPQDLEDTSSEQSVPMPEQGSYDEWFEYFRRNFGG